MSIEIEVGLENATRVKPQSQEIRLDEKEPTAQPQSKLRRNLIFGGAALVVLVAGLYLYYFNRESTDDAQVDGHITAVSAKVYGRVGEVLVTDNQPVKAGQPLVKLDSRDYQAALDQAAGQLALAESEAQSAGVDIPKTRENVASGTSSADAQLLGSQADAMRAEVTYEEAKTSDLAWAQANIDKSRANARLAQADLERFTPLMEKGEISKQQFDAAKANADATASALKADEEKFAQAQRSVEISKAQLEAARARVQQAQAGVASAKADTRQVAMKQADAAAKIAKVQQARGAVDAAKGADVVVLATDDLAQSPEQQALAAALVATGKPVIGRCTCKRRPRRCSASSS